LVNLTISAAGNASKIVLSRVVPVRRPDPVDAPRIGQLQFLIPQSADPITLKQDDLRSSSGSNPARVPVRISQTPIMNGKPLTRPMLSFQISSQSMD
jgi:hypothetical protein